MPARFGAESHGDLSDAPHLWRGLAGAWPMQEGGGVKAFDVSGYGNHGTLTNMDPATDWVVTEKGRALDFDGSNDGVLTSYLLPNNPCGTFAIWMKSADTTRSSYLRSKEYFYLLDLQDRNQHQLIRLIVV